MTYLYVFLVGGIICTIGQILIDKTKLTPARIVVMFVVCGVFLTAIGIYDKIVAFAKAGASVPIIGFGYSQKVLKKQCLNKVFWVFLQAV